MAETVATLRQKYFYRLFRIGVFLKGVDAVAEMFAGFVVLFVGPIAISNAIISISQDRLATHTHSIIAPYAISLAHLLSITPHKFLAAYLLARGLIKFFIIIALLLNRRWSYPAALIVLGIFLLYEVYLVTLGHSIYILALVLFDAMLLWLIWYEYKAMKTQLK